MIYGILCVVGIIGIAGTLWISRGRYEQRTDPIDRPWFSFSFDDYEHGVIYSIQLWLRSFLKKVIIIMLYLYRNISKKIMIKQVVKKKIRAFLSDHHETHRSPSEFWNSIRHLNKMKESALRKERQEAEQESVRASDEETS
jgi:late competence protein required for DNA uptake (superfamily II DNA/RNA helicase)